MNITKSTKPHVFSLGAYDSKFTGYYLDHHFNLWSNKRGDLVQIKSDRSELNGNIVNMKNLTHWVAQSDMWADYINSIRIQEVPELKPGTFILSLITPDGHVDFADKPKVHETEESAIEEVTRLVKHNPGKKFAYFKCCGIAYTGGVSWV